MRDGRKGFASLLLGDHTTPPRQELAGRSFFKVNAGPVLPILCTRVPITLRRHQLDSERRETFLDTGTLEPSAEFDSVLLES